MDVTGRATFVLPMGWVGQGTTVVIGEGVAGGADVIGVGGVASVLVVRIGTGGLGEDHAGRGGDDRFDQEQVGRTVRIVASETLHGEEGLGALRETDVRVGGDDGAKLLNTAAIVAGVTEFVGLGRRIEEASSGAGVGAVTGGAGLGEGQVAAVRTAVGQGNPGQPQTQEYNRYENDKKDRDKSFHESILATTR